MDGIRTGSDVREEVQGGNVRILLCPRELRQDDNRIAFCLLCGKSTRSDGYCSYIVGKYIASACRVLNRERYRWQRAAR